VTAPIEIHRARPEHAAALAAIYDEGIATGAATFATGPHTAAERVAWLAARSERAPVFVAERQGVVLGWSALAPFSHRPWYTGVAEYTVFIAAAGRRTGLGRLMLDHLIAQAPGFGYWKLVGMILSDNAAGLALARGAGFRVVGVHRAHARLGGRWRDVTVLERHLKDEGARHF
jgi:L-amino acid N-acyltransferase YncA